MSQRSLDEFGAYRKARELFDLAVADMKLTMERLRSEPRPYQAKGVREEAREYGD